MSEWSLIHCYVYLVNFNDSYDCSFYNTNFIQVLILLVKCICFLCQAFINMSGIVICIALLLLNVNLSVAQFYIRTPTNVSQKRILLSFNTNSIPTCFQKCKQTPCCKDIATVKNNDKKSFECYLLRNNETNDDAEERLLEVYLTRSITVSFLTYYVLIPVGIYLF